MPRRGGNREGSIFKRADGRWVAAVSLPGGKRLTKYGKTRRECSEWVQETRNQIDAGMTTEGARIRMDKFLDNWLDAVKPTLRPKTWHQYEQIVRQHIKPDLEAIRLKDLRPDHVQTLYTSQLERGLGPRSVRLIHAVLHRALNQALRWGIVSRNVCDAVDKPKQPRAEMRILDVEQAQVLLKAAEGHRLEALFHLAITTGLRQGDLLGLKWSDLDWDTGALQIQRQLQRVPGEGLMLVEPKSAAGRRSVVLGQTVLAKLRKHKKRQIEERLFAGGRWQEQDLIFRSTIGSPLDARNVCRTFKAILKATDLPDIRFHDLRHTAATLMLQQGIHPKVVQERLGHSSITLTLDTYSHVLPNMQQDAAAKMDHLFGASTG